MVFFSYRYCEMLLSATYDVPSASIRASRVRTYAFHKATLIFEKASSILHFAVIVSHAGGIVKCCVSGPDHAATFSSLLSTNSPFTNLAPALTSGTSL